MPSQQQLEKAEQERKDLERELQLLENAADPVQSAKRIMDYIAETEEPLFDPENPMVHNTGCCLIL
eukprot:UN01266